MPRSSASLTARSISASRASSGRDWNWTWGARHQTQLGNSPVVMTAGLTRDYPLGRGRVCRTSLLGGAQVTAPLLHHLCVEQRAGSTVDQHPDSSSRPGRLPGEESREEALSSTRSARPCPHGMPRRPDGQYRGQRERDARGRGDDHDPPPADNQAESMSATGHNIPVPAGPSPGPVSTSASPRGVVSQSAPDEPGASPI